MLLTGHGVEKNLVRGLELTRETAEAGNAASLFNMGVVYNGGTSIPEDSRRANEYFSEAIRKGFNYQGSRTEFVLPYY